MEAEIAAAIISVGGSLAMAGIGIACKKLKSSVKTPLQNTKLKKRILNHRIFNIQNTSRPIVIDSDDGRSQIFQYIQFDILCKCVQDSVTEWILTSYDKNIDDSDHIKYDKLGNDIHSCITNGTQMKTLIAELPIPLQKLTNVLLDDFLYELKAMLDCTCFESSDIGEGRSNKIIRFYHQILDVIHTLVLITLSKWISLSHQINGSLNGTEWNGQVISYVCFDKMQWSKHMNRLWSFTTNAGIMDTEYAAVYTTKDGSIGGYYGNFSKITGYDSEIVGEGINLLTCGLSYKHSKHNHQELSKIQHAHDAHESYATQVFQFNKQSNESYISTVYANPFISSSNTVRHEMFFDIIHKSESKNQKNHTLSAMLLQTSMMTSYVITSTQYKVGCDITMLDIYRHNISKGNVLNNIKFRENESLGSQMSLTHTKLDNIVHEIQRNVDLTSENNYNNDLVDTQIFTYMIDEWKIKAMIWFFPDPSSEFDLIIIVHTNLNFVDDITCSINDGHGSSFSKLKNPRKYTQNHPKKESNPVL